MQVITGDSNTFNDLLYPAQHQNNINYFQNQWNNLSEQTLSGIGDIGKSFINKAKQLTEKLTSNDALKAAKNALMSMGMSHRSGYILPFDSLGSLQMAPSHAMNWLMANPEVKHRYNNQTIHGYGDSYTPLDNKVGEDDYYYRKVTDGILLDTDESTCITQYLETDIFEEEKELSFDDQLTIMQNWEIQNIFMDQGEDPTNQLGGSL